MAAHTLISPVFLKHHYMFFKHFPFALTAALIGSRGFHSFSGFWHGFFIKLNHGEKYQISIWLMVRKHETYPLTRAHRELSCHQLAWFQYCVTGNRGVWGEGKTGDVWLLGLSERTVFLSALYCGPQITRMTIETSQITKEIIIQMLMRITNTETWNGPVLLGK